MHDPRDSVKAGAMLSVIPPRRKRWLAWLLVLGLLFMVLPVAMAALARTRVVREHAGREAAAALRRELGLLVEIEEVDVDTQRLSVVARNIKLTHPQHGRFVSASLLSIRPSWWALLRGRLDLHAITIEHATVWLKVRDGRVQNLPVLPEGNTTQRQRLELPFHWLHLQHARLVVDADPIGHGELSDIEIQINASRDEYARVEVGTTAGFVQHAQGRDQLSRLELLAKVALDSIAIERLRLETPDAQLAVNKAELVLPLGQRYRGQVELQLAMQQLLRWPLGIELPPLRGKLSVKADLSGDAGGARGTAKVGLERVAVDQYGLGERVDLDVRFDAARVHASGMAELIRGGGGVALEANLGLSEGLPLKVQADVHNVSFAKLMEQLGVSENAIVDWTLAGNFSLSGTLSPLDLAGPLRMPTRDFKVLRDAWHRAPERRIMGVSSAKLAGTVRVRADGIHLQDIDIQLPRSRLNATVLLGFDNQLRVQAHALDWGLSDCSPLLQFALDGRGDFTVDVKGTFSDPLVHGRVRAANFAFGGFDFGTLQTDFALDPDLTGVTFPRIAVTKNKSRYALDDGFLDFRNDAFKAGGKLDVERLLAADFYKIFHYDGDERYEPYQAAVSGKASIEYTLGYPEDSPNGTLVTALDMDIAEADLDGYRFKDGHFAGTFRWLDHALGYRGGELEIEQLTLKKGAGTLNVSGRMRQQGALDLVVLGDAILVRDTEPLHERIPGLRGTLAVTGSVKGVASKPRADLEVVATGLTLDGRPLGDGRTYVKLTDKDDPWVAEALSWTAGAPPAKAPCGRAREGLARGQWPADPPLRTNEGPLPRLDQPMAWLICGQALDGKLTADLMLGRTQAYPVAGQITWNDLVLDRFLPSGGRRAPLHGLMSGALTLRDGLFREPQTLAGDIVLSKLAIGQLRVELNNQGPIEFSFDRGNFQVKSATLVGPDSQLAITGSGSLRGGLGLSIDGHVDLGLLSTLSQTISHASGNVALGFKVTGKLHEPSIYGHALVRNAALKIASFPETVREVNGKVTFSARRVLLEDFSAKIAGGKVALRGAAELAGAGVGSYALQINADGLALAPRDGIDLKFGGNGEINWKRGDRIPMLSGRLRLDEATYNRPIKMDRTLGELYAPERATGLAYDPEGDTLGIDLVIEQVKPIAIRNNLIHAELRLENDKLPFRLVGTDQRFGLRGSMSVMKGTVRFRETDFVIRQADIRFEDETRIDPHFDVRASSEVHRRSGQNDWRIEMHAYGNRDQFQFALSSEPYLSEDDIALLLTVGMTHSELALLQTSDLTSAAALEALATVSGVESEVQRALPQIDDFHIASTYSERSNRTEPQLVIGKRIADNVQLRASTGIAESRDFSTGVELELNEKTSVQAVYNNQNATTASQIGDVGVDLKWRLEFD